jgi:hypothetical protein
MHLQQTKRASRGTGGPQYYFHDLSDPVKTFLRKKKAARVALVTPYGATKSDYSAVSTDAKLDSNQRPVLGNVGHDRIQQGSAPRVSERPLGFGISFLPETSNASKLISKSEMMFFT